MKLAFIAFTKQGKALADSLAQDLGGTVVRGGREAGLAEWTRENFVRAEGLVFVGAAGIAVRAIAPYVADKSSDPAVVVVDEGGRYAIPILGGHSGGANDLARRISALCGAQAVITTATDGEGVFAVDEWAKRQGMAILNPEKIKVISAALLEGDTIRLCSDWPVEGKVPEGLILTGSGSGQIRVSFGEDLDGALSLVPRVLVLGVGCRKGIDADTFEEVFRRFLERAKVSEKGIARVCSLDRKEKEAGLKAFCRRHGFSFTVYSAEELASAEGTFSSSDYVLSVTGVDNVCERSAVLGSGGTLVVSRWAEQGVTMALAAAPFHPDWRWQDE